MANSRTPRGLIQILFLPVNSLSCLYNVHSIGKVYVKRVSLTDVVPPGVRVRRFRDDGQLSDFGSTRDFPHSLHHRASLLHVESAQPFPLAPRKRHAQPVRHRRDDYSNRTSKCAELAISAVIVEARAASDLTRHPSSGQCLKRCLI